MSKRKKREQEHEDPVCVQKKAKVESRKKKSGFSQAIYSETSYYVKNGLRHVKPYFFTFTTHAKGRWVGSKIIDVFCKEFQSETPKYYERAIKAGKVTVNGVVATMDTVIRDNELITHRVHRHEPPVSAEPISIIHQDEELVVLDKPASIPVHPCGRYRHNSMVFLLAKEYDLPNLHTVHRLDRLTSGLLMFARSVSKAQKMEIEIRERKVSKVYVCRVEGEFSSALVECNEPILVVTHKVGVCRVDPQGKECSTKFTRLSFNGVTSVVKCEPRTGRMHQIRVHLQWLGHPIINDPIYNHPAWKQVPTDSDSGDHSNIELIIKKIVQTNYSSELEEKPLTKEGENEGVASTATSRTCGEREESATSSSDGQLTQDTVEQERKLNCATNSVQSVPPSSLADNPVDVSEADSEGVSTEQSASTAVDTSEMEDGKKEIKDMIMDPDCSECQLDRPDPSPSNLLMFLHALSYKGEGWEFSTPLPNWARPDWVEDH